jgi:hypothetical protein
LIGRSLVDFLGGDRDVEVLIGRSLVDFLGGDRDFWG